MAGSRVFILRRRAARWTMCSRVSRRYKRRVWHGLVNLTRPGEYRVLRLAKGSREPDGGGVE